MKEDEGMKLEESMKLEGRMKLIADLHMHTKGSDTLFDTLSIMTSIANKNGLRYIACTDHAPITSNKYTSWDFDEWEDIPKKLNEVRILRGVEADILDFKGNLSLGEETLFNLEIVLAALHTYCIKPGTLKEHTEAYEAILCNPYVDILAHPGESFFPYDEEYIMKLAAEQGKGIELNSLSQKNDPKSIQNQMNLIKLSKKYRTMLCVSSDAQKPSSIGEFDTIPATLSKEEIPVELVINSSEDNMEKFLEQRKQVKENKYMLGRKGKE